MRISELLAKTGEKGDKLRIVFGLAEFIAVFMFYAFFFFVLTWPSILNFGNKIFTACWDGFQTYWNLWWFNYALLDLHCNPFHTNYLFFPSSPSLVVHTFHPFGGALAMPVQLLFGPVVAFNVVMVFGFAMSGYGAYLLAKEFVKRSFPAIIAGYVFTFCNYHFAHDSGHLAQVLMQWIPFYLLFLYRFFTRNSVTDGFLAGLFLFLVLMCDHYGFVFCAIASIIFGVWALVFHREKILCVAAWPRVLAFVGTCCVTIGPFVVAFLRVTSGDSIIEEQSHSAIENGMDTLALFIPGGHWFFGDLTVSCWWRLGNIYEHSVHVGSAACLLAVLGFLTMKNQVENRYLFVAVFAVFFLLSLGKDIRIFGFHFAMPMPYDVLERVFPVIRLGGTPVRFVVVAICCLSVFVAFGVAWLDEKVRRRRWLIFLLVLGFMELIPKPLVLSPIRICPAAMALAVVAEKKPGPVIDMAHTPDMAMVQQTWHHQPIQTGYVGRVQQNVGFMATIVDCMAKQQRFDELANQYGFRYVLSTQMIEGLEEVYSGDVRLYRINVPGLIDECAVRKKTGIEN